RREQAVDAETRVEGVVEVGDLRLVALLYVGDVDDVEQRELVEEPEDDARELLRCSSFEERAGTTQEVLGVVPAHPVRDPRCETREGVAVTADLGTDCEGL